MKKNNRKRDFKTLEKKPRKSYYQRCTFNTREFDMRLWPVPGKSKRAG